MYLKKAKDMFVPFRVGDGDTAIFVAIELEDWIILIPGWLHPIPSLQFRFIFL